MAFGQSAINDNFFTSMTLLRSAAFFENNYSTEMAVEFIRNKIFFQTLRSYGAQHNRFTFALLQTLRSSGALYSLETIIVQGLLRSNAINDIFFTNMPLLRSSTQDSLLFCYKHYAPTERCIILKKSILQIALEGAPPSLKTSILQRCRSCGALSMTSTFFILSYIKIKNLLKTPVLKSLNPSLCYGELVVDVVV